MTALVTVLIGVQAGRDLAEALVGGYRPAMIALTGLCVAAAVLSAIYVRDCRGAGPAFAAPAPYHGCVLPDPGIAREPITTTSQMSEPS